VTFRKLVDISTKMFVFQIRYQICITLMSCDCTIFNNYFSSIYLIHKICDSSRHSPASFSFEQTKCLRYTGWLILQGFNTSIKCIASKLLEDNLICFISQRRKLMWRRLRPVGWLGWVGGWWSVIKCPSWF